MPCVEPSSERTVACSVVRTYSMTLREYRVMPSEEEDRLGLRTKFGGQPDWEQDDETPSCSSCLAPMTLAAQIDSIEHDYRNNPHAVGACSGEQHFMFGDVGLIYVFFCFPCSASMSVFQCG